MPQSHEYYMNLAFDASKPSQDPQTQVGAVIVNQVGNVVSDGCNNFPNGCDNKFPWTRDKTKDNKYLYVVHAEANAIIKWQHGDDDNCAIYVTLFPCNECAKLIIQSKIKRVFYAEDKYGDLIETKASKKMLDTVGIEYVQIVCDNKKND